MVDNTNISPSGEGATGEVRGTKFDFYKYNPYLNKFARELRSNSTKSEIRLWKTLLKAKQMKGYTFNRQRPVLNYIADFMCKELRLIIELDGITHHYPGADKRDEIRQNILEKNGFSVLRFSDHEIFHDLDSVKEKITRKIIEIESGFRV